MNSAANTLIEVGGRTYRVLRRNPFYYGWYVCQQGFWPFGTVQLESRDVHSAKPGQPFTIYHASGGNRVDGPTFDGRV